ncbi:MAG: hypothetical protein FJX74_02055, partial [Armatimonadetes bacterium]|nr:hypothetical protein [Armatimonadota bacterium]
LALVAGLAHADGDLRTRGVPNLAEGARAEGSCSAGAVGAKYGIDSATDGSLQTWWASCDHPQYPVTVRLTFPQAIPLDTLAFVQTDNPTIYTNWKTLLIAFSDGSTVEEQLGDSAAPVVLRFERRTTEWLELTIVEAHDPTQHYVTLREVMVFDDREQKVSIKMPPAEGWKNPDLTPQGRAEHPCVYLTPEDVARARRRIETDEWARQWFAATKASADEWVAKDEAWIASIIPAEGACFAYGFTGCPICRASWGQWGGARCNFEMPGQVTCANGHVLPDAEHPDPGTGHVGPDGRIHYFVGSYNAWVVETLQFKALQPLAYAYTLTGDEQYANRAADLLDRLAVIYPSCDKGSWDYPSNPPSGRFCRPWYQVARVLIHFVDWYDQIHGSPTLDRPSAHEGLTRRENIETNLLQNGARYCYEQSLHGRLHNGEADYIRGALAVGCCLGIPWYIDWAYDGPYGVLNMVRNNVDRDGRYFETSTMYADHTRELYLTFAEPLLNYRSEKYPAGVNLYDDPQFRSFYVLPQSSIACLGKSPRFGDSGPDTVRSFLPGRPESAFDRRLAERLHARVNDPGAKARFAALLGFLSGNDVAAARNAGAELPWLLFHGTEPPEGNEAALDARLDRRIRRSDFLGQKGIGILRGGSGQAAQAALLRFGPTLNHGHLDDLNLSYYALGYELTYDLGYGLGSTHTQVGWAKQTASHNLVLVDETPQGADGSGTGGSLHLFADLPGLKLMEASSESSYARQGVSTYRRLVALIGEGPESYLLDIFRVVGGRQHDYLLHSFGTEAEFGGVALGEAQPGSLAGADTSWGEQQLNDGDMAGHPNQPYWSPPPGNGLGFLMAPQRGRTDGTWTATWPVPEGDGFLRLTMLGEPDTEVISAWAPGILPNQPKARYAIARRQGQDLAGAFIALMEPYGRRLDGTAIEAGALGGGAEATGGEVKYLDNLRVLLHKAEQAGDELRWTFEVADAGDYAIALDHYQSPSYGRTQLLIDGEPVGRPMVGTASSTQAAPLAHLGTVRLGAGRHQAALRAVADDGAGHFWFGFRALWLLEPAAADDAGPRPFIRSAECLAGPEDPHLPTGALVTLEGAGERQDVFLSAGDADRERAFGAGDRAIRLQGAFAHLRTEGNRPREAHLIGVKRLVVGDLTLECAEAEHVGEVRATAGERAAFETGARLPADGRLNGELVLFSNPGYSRNTAYRIAEIETLPDGSRVTLESPSFVLGTGILEDDPRNGRELTSLLAHEYARSDSPPGTQFLSGKLLRGEGFATRVIRTRFGQLMDYEVQSTDGMAAGDEFVILDVQPGDAFRIPTLAYVQWDGGEAFKGRATTTVDILRDVQRLGTIGPSPG